VKTLALALTLFLVSFPVLSQTNTRQSRRRTAPVRQIVTNNQNNQTLPLRRVILYSNGVAYFERRGTVTGRAEINLEFKESQVDDVLKSMLVLDLGQGRIGAVSYNSSAPSSARLAEIPFSIESGTDGTAAGGLAGVLRQLQGARVAVSTQNRTATGAILTIEERRAQIDADRPPTVTQTVVIAGEAGEITSFDLAEVRSIRLLDEGTRRDINEFANASASARRRDAKNIVVTSDGTGAREMMVSYTIAAPIWKTTYRVVMDEAGQPFFQGWAIVDNVSEEDWTNVQLSLVSGTPVSFIQPIQQPLYRYRPVVPIPENLNLQPQTYEPSTGEGSIGSISGTISDPNGAVIPGATVTAINEATGATATTSTTENGFFSFAQLPPANYTLSVSATGFNSLRITDINLRTRRSYNAGSLTLRVGTVTEAVTVTAGSDVINTTDQQLSNTTINGQRSIGFLRDGASPSAPLSVNLSDAISGGNSGVTTAASGAEAGDLFEYRIDQPVTVPRDRSALIPILQTRLEGERVSIYNESVRRDRPLGGMRLRNTSPLTLESGSLTVIDGNAYAGEALMERLRPNEERFISFALDLGTLVTARATQQREPVFLVRIQNGVFQAHFYQTEQKTYVVTNQTDRPRIVFIEHPTRTGWTLSDNTRPPTERTANMYRFRVELAPRATVEVPVTERQALMETYALTNLTTRDLELFISRRYVDDETRAALARLLDLKSRITGIDQRIAAADREIAEISEDQTRVRENIRALGQTPEARELIARYVARAGEQETRIENLRNERRTAEAERARLQAELDNMIRSFALDRRFQ
jgi:hypothetical protein